ncbi:MAG: hypothetical protein ACXWBN_10895 [Acidimicrobiales bacterium]
MTGLDVSKLLPPDALAALRSYPRRFRQEVASFEGDDSIDELAARIGPDGESAIQILSDVARTWTVLAEALRQTLTSDDAVLHPAVLDPAQRSWDTPPSDSLDEVLTELDHAADDLVERMASVSEISDWNRRAAVAGGGEVSALDLARSAVVAGHDGLDAVRAALTAARR